MDLATYRNKINRAFPRLPTRYLFLLISLAWFYASSAQSAVPDFPIDASNPIATYGESVNYVIYRKGKKIGSHTIKFEKGDSTLKVTVNSDINVKVLKLSVFKFKYNAEEVWEQGQLQSITSEVREKGEVLNNSMIREDDVFRLSNDSGESIAANVGYTSNHWNPDVLTSDRIFNTLTGKINTVTIEAGETGNIKTTKSTIKASRYVYTGQLDAQTWYDEQGRWVKLSFKGEDGSVIEYVIDE